MVRWRIIALLIFAVTIRVQSQLDSNGFLSIDCGLPANSSYVDNAKNIKYVSDEQFIDTGNNSDISTNLSREFNTVRYFPTGTRNCYTMRSLTVGFKYLIRAGFYYGNYDNKNKPPIFDIYLGINFWNKIDPYSSLQYEIIVNATSDYLELCLVNTGNGNPFISWLHLRKVNRPYLSANSTQSLQMMMRLNIGGGNQQLVMYPDDSNDLWWSTYNDKGWKVISTNSTIETNPDLQTPSVVLQTAAATSSTLQNLTLVWNSDDKSTEYYFVLQFYDIRTSSTGQREFDILVNGQQMDESIILDPQHPWHFTPHQLSGFTNYTVSLMPTSISILPPLLNAFELYKVAPVGIQTYAEDVAAINSVQKFHNIKKGWSGDPCLPMQFIWTGITCTTDDSNIARITGLNLSSSSLTGPLSNSIGNLTALEYLYLSKNDLSGSLPSSLDNLMALKLLDIRENPKISTALPPELDKKQKNGSLDYRVEDINAISSPSPSPKKNVIIIVIAVVGILLVIALVIATVMWLKRKYMGSIAPNENESSPLAINDGNIPHRKQICLNFENRKFCLKDLKKITNNLNDKNIIGSGGSGKVYLGKVKIGQEVVQVAVKMLSGQEEWLAEAENLTRARHRNLVSLMGYCTDKNSMAIVYEYMQEGNLYAKLQGNNKPLSWKQRVRIAYESALGLHYLHTGCTKTLIHGDVKTSNILLNATLEAKIADLGLSKAIDETHVTTEGVAGTPGYLDPEYCTSRHLTARSDVYSFGVVLLEIITGRSAIFDMNRDIVNLVKWVRQELSLGDIARIADTKMEGKYDKSSVQEIRDLALSCTEPTSSERPTMDYVVDKLKKSYTKSTENLVTAVSQERFVTCSNVCFR